MPATAPETSRHLEVERKFDVVESTVSPSFEGIAAVACVEKSPTQSLDATYFDTPTHDLARNKVTLRRRTGGTDAGTQPLAHNTIVEFRVGPDAELFGRVRKNSRPAFGTSSSRLHYHPPCSTVPNSGQGYVCNMVMKCRSSSSTSPGSATV